MNPDNPESVALSERNIFERLMNGIRLSPMQVEKARRLIHEELAQRLKINSEDADAAKKVRDSYNRRDDALKALLSTPTERTRFEKNALTLHPFDIPKKE